MSCHFTPIKIAIIKKSDSTRCWQGCGETGTLIHCCWECDMVQLLWKSLACPQNVRRKRIESECPPKTCTQMLRAALCIGWAKGEINWLSIRQRMNQQCGLAPQRSIIQPQKERLRSHAATSRTLTPSLRWLKEASYKRLHVRWFLLHEVSSLGKSREMEEKWLVRTGYGREGWGRGRGLCWLRVGSVRTDGSKDTFFSEWWNALKLD